MDQRLRRAAARMVVAALLAALVVVGGASPAVAISPDIVISQVYGGGGNAGATLTHDFVELYNRGARPYRSRDGRCSTPAPQEPRGQRHRSPVRSRPASTTSFGKRRGPAARPPCRRPTRPAPSPCRPPQARSRWSPVPPPSGCGADCDAATGVRDFVGYGDCERLRDGPHCGPQQHDCGTARRRRRDRYRQQLCRLRDRRAEPAQLWQRVRASTASVGLRHPRHARDRRRPGQRGVARRSPVRRVRVEGVVTGDFNGAPRASAGSTSRTTLLTRTRPRPTASSWHRRAAVAEGDRVRVTGTASESFGQTQVAATAVDVCGTGTDRGRRRTTCPVPRA